MLFFVCQRCICNLFSEPAALLRASQKWQGNIIVFISHDFDYVDNCLTHSVICLLKINMSSQSHGFLNFHTPRKSNKGINTECACHLNVLSQCKYLIHVISKNKNKKKPNNNGKLSLYELCTLGQGFKITNTICHSSHGHLRLSCWSSYISIRSVLLRDEFMINYTLTANDRRRILGCNDGSAEEREFLKGLFIS